MAPDIRFVERRAAQMNEADTAIALAGREPEAAPKEPAEDTTLPIPEHLHQLWLACGLDDEE